MPDKPSISDDEFPSFEKAVARLEEIVVSLEQEEMSLEAALAIYEEGVKLANFCRSKLNSVELRVQELSLE